MSILRMTDLDLNGKRVLIREDLNVPVKEGEVTSEQRILAALPTLRLALEKGAAVMVTSHLGRPKEGVWTAEDSLAPVAARLSRSVHVSSKRRLRRASRNEMSAASQHSATTSQASMPNGFVPRAKAWAKGPPRLAIHAGMP